MTAVSHFRDLMVNKRGCNQWSRGLVAEKTQFALLLVKSERFSEVECVKLQSDRLGVAVELSWKEALP